MRLDENAPISEAPGPLHDERKEILSKLMALPLETGDVLYRASDARGPWGFPFSRMVAWLTKSKYSHAAIIIMLHEKPHVVEVNDNGTTLFRLVDWIDTCYTEQFAIYRMKYWTRDISQRLQLAINDFLENDPDYDFTFDDKNKWYCTESVAWLYQNLGFKPFQSNYIRDVVSTPAYLVLLVLGWLAKRLTKCSLPLHQPVFIPGNSKYGMIASDRMALVYEHGTTNERSQDTSPWCYP